MTTEIGAVHFNGPFQRGVCLIRCQRFPDLVSQHVSRLVLHVEITTELQCTHALGRVREQRHCQQDIPYRQLPARKQRPGRDAELVRATLALEDATGLVLVHSVAATARANRIAVSVGPTDSAEQAPCLVFRHPRDLNHGQRPGLC